MDDIVSILQERAMNQPTQPTPTEKSQIAIYWTHPTPNLISRFNSVKKGEKEYAKLKKAWTEYNRVWPLDHKQKAPPRLRDIDGDMFITTIDLNEIAAINFIDHTKRAKFIPQ